MIKKKAVFSAALDLSLIISLLFSDLSLMADAVVSFAVERIGDLLIQEATFLHGVTDGVAEIQTELKRMQCFLKDVDARQDENEVIRNWVSEIRDAVYDAEDVIETFAFEEAQKRRRGLQNILKRFACIFSELKALHKAGTEMDAIKNRISSLTASLQSYDISRVGEVGGGEGSVSRHERQPLPRRTYSHVVDEDTVGMEGGVKILVEQLMKPNDQCSLVSIWGMGGLGKTTLAKKVFHHPDVRRHFDCFAWTCISTQFNLRAVVRGILINLVSPSGEQRKEIDTMSDDELLKKVYEIQGEKKCLVILDDLWTIEDWESLRPAFPLRKEGSKILLTTRNHAVALHADPLNVFLHQPNCLTDEESWELLQRKAFPRNNDADSIITNNMKKLGKEMVRYCSGLPLAVVALGGLLATKHTFYEWEMVNRNIKSSLRTGRDHHEQTRVSDVLALSYRDLPYHLKPCFLYLAYFPEDYEIQTKALFGMWVAEGIISRVEEKTLEDVAEEYLNELIGRCMVQVGARSSNGRAHTCHLHDLMRDLCLTKVKEENFLEVVNLKQVNKAILPSVETAVISNKVRRCAIYLDENEEEDVDIRVKSDDRLFSKYSSECATHIRSLLIFCNERGKCYSMLRKLDLKDFKLLRVLNLEGLGLEEIFLRAIGNLIHLKYLSFKHALLLCFPSSIRNLRFMQTLDLRFKSDDLVTCSRIRDLISKMKWLRHLYLPRDIDDEDNGKVQWENLRNLETLRNFDAGKWAIKDLAQLSKLGNLEMVGVKSFKQLEVIFQPSSHISSHLHTLALSNGSAKIEEIDQLQLSTCHHLYKLYLEGEISHLPGHHQFPPNLSKLTLTKSLVKQDPMPILERLVNLTSLQLKGDSYIGEEMVFSTNGFPQLKYLTLSGIIYLKRLSVGKHAMRHLRSLRITACNSLEMVPEGLRYLTTLQVLEIREMPREFVEKLQVIKGKEGEDFYKIQHVPSVSFHQVFDED